MQCLVQVNGHSSCPVTSEENYRKRPRPRDEDEPEDGVRVEWRKKNRKKSSEKETVKQTLGDERKSQGKHVEEEEKVEKKKKKKKRKKTAEGNADIPKPVASSNKPTATQNVSSSGSSSTLKFPPKSPPLTLLSPKGRSKDNSESWETPSVLQSTIRSQKPASSTPESPRGKVLEPCNSDTEEEVEPVNQPLTKQPGSDVAGQWSGRGYCRGETRHGGPGERGRGRGRGVGSGHSGRFEFSRHEAKEPSYLTDSLTNTSVVLQVCVNTHMHARTHISNASYDKESGSISSTVHICVCRMEQKVPPNRTTALCPC